MEVICSTKEPCSYTRYRPARGTSLLSTPSGMLMERYSAPENARCQLRIRLHVGSNGGCCYIFCLGSLQDAAESLLDQSDAVANRNIILSHKEEYRGREKGAAESLPNESNHVASRNIKISHRERHEDHRQRACSQIERSQRQKPAVRLKD